ncbi:hypothetical protein C2869_02975 [Saccharobesus litoralis]|uniref:Uncharacterized protein n=1 Tax=Saccharobesus litoralis TaxID=2172099 RepID=A0A2S0VML7_9ALTE|nr:transporter substrate-binding domain-containing protein [Saccharobesus litoralis]AWB65461.1 hypothetical protein C2869_02975 [Saccharobesus litoralis]
MKKVTFCSLGYLALLICLLFSSSVHAQSDFSNQEIDQITMTSRQSELDVREEYISEILDLALSLSKDKYGEYVVKQLPISMPNDQTFYELSLGKTINLAMSGATTDKDHLAIPIRIPIRRGILNYRLLVINKNKQALFKGITSFAQLKALTAGIHANAVTAEIMKLQGFSVVEGASYDGMFKQLSHNRFDYIPRGVHEAYDELQLRAATLDNLMIEPNLAIYMPMPYYIYVSPKFPRLVKRIEYGLEKMIEQKLIKTIFDKYYAEDVARANLAQRTIIDIGNPFLSSKTPFQRKELWIDEYAIKPTN